MALIQTEAAVPCRDVPVRRCRGSGMADVGTPVGIIASARDHLECVARAAKAGNHVVVSGHHRELLAQVADVHVQATVGW